MPATKTFTNQVITFLYLATRLGGGDLSQLETLPDLMEETIKVTAPQMEALAQSINHWNDLYCLGYGATYPIALEGALKLKEITYAHCEGMLSTEFKHGPLSAVDRRLSHSFRWLDRMMCPSSSAASTRSPAAAAGQLPSALPIRA